MQAVEGDRAALDELLFDHYETLLRHVSAKIPAELRSTVGGEDILQEVFIDVIRRIEDFEPQSDAAFLAWLKTIADNRRTDKLRAHKARKRGGEQRRVSNSPQDGESSAGQLLDAISSGLTSPSGKATREELMRAMRIHVASLPDHQREAILLMHLEGLSREQVAERMNLTVGQVRGLLQRGIAKLRELMEGDTLFDGA